MSVKKLFLNNSNSDDVDQNQLFHFCHDHDDESDCSSVLSRSSDHSESKYFPLPIRHTNKIPSKNNITTSFLKKTSSEKQNERELRLKNLPKNLLTSLKSDEITHNVSTVLLHMFMQYGDPVITFNFCKGDYNSCSIAPNKLDITMPDLNQILMLNNIRSIYNGLFAFSDILSSKADDLKVVGRENKEDRSEHINQLIFWCKEIKSMIAIMQGKKEKTPILKPELISNHSRKNSQEFKMNEFKSTESKPIGFKKTFHRQSSHEQLSPTFFGKNLIEFKPTHLRNKSQDFDKMGKQFYVSQVDSTISQQNDNSTVNTLRVPTFAAPLNVKRYDPMSIKPIKPINSIYSEKNYRF